MLLKIILKKNIERLARITEKNSEEMKSSSKEINARFIQQDEYFNRRLIELSEGLIRWRSEVKGALIATGVFVTIIMSLGAYIFIDLRDEVKVNYQDIIDQIIKKDGPR